LTKDLLNKHNDKYGTMILLLVWAFFFLLHLQHYGIVTTLEAEKYIDEAKNLVTHKGLSAARYMFYSVTIFIIAMALKLKIGFAGAVIAQSLLNLFAIYIFYRALRQIFINTLIPLFIVCLIIAFSPYSSWNVFLFTESVFYSCILLLVSAIINHSIKKSNQAATEIICMLVLTILSRPLGVLFIPAVLIYFYSCGSRKVKLIILPIAVTGTLALVYITNIVFTTTNDATITQSAQEGCIICGIKPAANTSLDLLQDANPVRQLWYYISHNFSHFAQLGVARLKAFFLMTRPYYSLAHNLLLLVTMIPLYLLAVAGIWMPKEKQYKPVFNFVIVSIVAFAAAIMLQCDDYHNRFILGIFPFFVLLSAKAVEYMAGRKKAI
jgi:hypothetical protein